MIGVRLTQALLAYLKATAALAAVTLFQCAMCQVSDTGR